MTVIQLTNAVDNSTPNGTSNAARELPGILKATLMSSSGAVR
ncbi:hypothetical protein [Cellvibrio sp. UBA7661]